MSSIRKLRRAQNKFKVETKTQLNMAKIELVPGQIVTFVHDFPEGNFGPGDSFQTAFDNWDMKEITAQSFIKYVKSKNSSRVCMTEEKFLKKKS